MKEKKVDIEPNFFEEDRPIEKNLQQNENNSDREGKFNPKLY